MCSLNGVTLVQHHSQNINNDTLKIHNISIITRIFPINHLLYYHFIPSLVPGNHQSVLHFYNLCHFKEEVIQMEWYNMQLFGTAFCHSVYLSGDFSKVFYQQSVPFSCWVVFPGTDEPQFIIHLMRESWTVSRLWLLQMCKTTTADCTLSSLRTLSNFSRVAVTPFYIPTLQCIRNLVIWYLHHSVALSLFSL